VRLTGKRWGLYTPPRPNGRPRAKAFASETERDEWVRQNPLLRKAVGKRHPVVKQFRQDTEGV
jgi:hypothetical protein